MEMRIKWNRIGENEYAAKVYGGWMIKQADARVENSNYEIHSRNRGKHTEQFIQASVAMVFIPDPEHKWEKMDKATKLLKPKEKEPDWDYDPNSPFY